MKVTMFITSEYCKGKGGAAVLLVAEKEGHKPATKYFYEEGEYSTLALLAATTRAMDMITKECEVSIVTDINYLFTLVRNQKLYEEGKYRKKDGKVLANLNMVKAMYMVINSKVNLIGSPFSYLAKSGDNVIYKLKRKLFNDINGGIM